MIRYLYLRGFDLALNGIICPTSGMGYLYLGFVGSSVVFCCVDALATTSCTVTVGVGTAFTESCQSNKVNIKASGKTHTLHFTVIVSPCEP